MNDTFYKAKCVYCSICIAFFLPSVFPFVFRTVLFYKKRIRLTHMKTNTMQKIKKRCIRDALLVYRRYTVMRAEKMSSHLRSWWLRIGSKWHYPYTLLIGNGKRCDRFERAHIQIFVWCASQEVKEKKRRRLKCVIK